MSSCIKFFNRQEAYILVLVLVAWAFMSISWPGNTNLALFKALKLAEFSLLFFYVAHNALNKPLLRNTVGFIVALGFIQATIGIAQAVLQHSVGLFWLKESLISVNVDGVAKIVLFGHKFIRAYGLFPHPNILGGFLLVSIVFTFAYRMMFRASKNVSWGGTIMYIILAVQVVALLCTFSKSAILGLFFIICYGGYRVVSRGTFSSFTELFRARISPIPTIIHDLMRVKSFYKYIGTFIIVFGLLITILGFNIDSSLLKSFNERLLFLNVSRETIVSNPIVGLGMGQFVSEMQKYSSVFLADWQYQPVHNVFLLIWSELGIIGLVLFILFLWKVFRSSIIIPRLPADEAGGIYVFKGILLGFIIIMLFDHYFWDIQQGQIIFWMMLGLVVGMKNGEK
ncbi:MAG: hypothetical protein WC608_03405 [Parcubacteria group bacterium]